MKNYIEKDIKKLWSFGKYHEVYREAPWTWRNMPFSDDINKVDGFYFDVEKEFNNCSILEVGSSMGQGYNFLKNQNNVDTSNYLGIDVSKVAYEHCIKNYPETNWLNENFSEYALEKKFDYSYERHSVHHMPRPLEQFEKILKNTNYAFTTTFRGCLNGPTISDLDIGYFETENGKYFMNIINFSELINIGLKHNFNNIRIDFRGLHEDIPTKPDNDGMVLSSKINRKDILLSRFIISFRKNLDTSSATINLVKKKLYSPKNFFIIRKIEKKIMELKKSF